MSEEKKKVVVKAVKPKKVSVKPSSSELPEESSIPENRQASTSKIAVEKTDNQAVNTAINKAPNKSESVSESKKPAVYNQWWFWLILAAVILGVAALATRNNTEDQTAASDTANSSQTAVAEESTAKESEGISVDENLLTVEVTMPAAFFEDETPEEIQASAKEAGFLSCTVNSDGSVTYKMTKGKRTEMLQNYKKEIDSTIQEYTSGGENAPQSFKSIAYNDKVTQFDVRVDRTAYENSWFDSLYAMGLYMLGGYYQILDGVPNDQVDVIVNFIDDATGEVIESGSYQEALANSNS
ncbi:MAG: hypothetical protein IJ709_12790 [Selenomonas sp.]|nr:hypothetical protein [Selenomonas sp.]